ncbi:AAA family ATPase [Burkholderia multivorans]|uniref:AAA family ATPase n=1 Tax=Burkholderia multivorans TaxID=87883 RepID=UPI0011B2706D|nr:AAA family ATPase [Burkholderia multivorans]MBJ9614604.1 AAA family ATPase [Burkholderia multivorans]MBU9329300.1 AAA family ATPase [Burkholderia multivorans]MBU9532413.1 AAA family ATPase [Burkholderia multivorans]MDR8785434.1 DNA replication and repair protein RecF [Burkholderia multivorans]MDR8827227.1 DNA replication and repair protein RecF [Burkholderia multivorans]
MIQSTEAEVDVRLEEVQINAYRSCVSTSFHPHKELSALIGINGAGKTNVLQAIRLLRGGRRARYKFDEQREKDPDSEVTAWFRVSDVEKPIGLKMRFSIMESSRRADELVAVSETWNLATITGSRTWRNLPPTDFFHSGIRTEYYADNLLLFDSESNVGRISKRDIERSGIDLLENKKVVDAISAISKFRQGINYYSASKFTDPTRCPSSFEVDEDGDLSSSYGATPHLKFIYELYKLKSSNEALYSAYSTFVSRHQLGLISRITWKEIELSSYTAEVRSGGGVKKSKREKH